MVVALMVAGLMLTALSLWQVSRLLREAEQAPARLDALVDELVATAEAATATVADRAEALTALLAAADERIASLRSNGESVGPSALSGRPQAQAGTPTLTEEVGARIAAGQDEATIARELGMARTAVRLAMRAAGAGGDR